MKPTIKKLQLGKNGLTEEFLHQLKSTFENSGIVKVSLLKSATRNKDDAKKIGQELVDSLGKNYDFKLIGYVLTVMKFRKNVRK